MATPFHAEVVTPERVLFSGDVEEVVTRTDVGEIAFLAHHTEFVGALDITVLTLQSSTDVGEPGPGDGSAPGARSASTGSLRFAVHGGFVHVADNRVVVLAPVAEPSDEIDVGRARAALESARERLGREGPPRAPEGLGQRGAAPEVTPGAAAQPAAGDDGTPLTGARLALLAPSSAAAALRRAEVRLAAAGADEG